MNVKISFFHQNVRPPKNNEHMGVFPFLFFSFVARRSSIQPFRKAQQEDIEEEEKDALVGGGEPGVTTMMAPISGGFFFVRPDRDLI